MNKFLRFLSFLVLLPISAFACDNGFYADENNECVECPIGYSGSDGNRESVNDCFIKCVNQTTDAGTVYAKTEKVYWVDDAYLLCEYDVVCDPGYYYSGDVNYIVSDNNLVWVHPDVALRGYGGQYIDTGVPGNNDNLRFEIKYEWVNFPEANSYIGVFGNYNGREDANATRLIQYANLRTHVNLNSKAGESNDITKAKRTGVVYTDFFDSKSFTSDGKTVKLNATKGIENKSNILLFADISTMPSEIKIYYFKVWDGDKLIRYMVPVNVGTIINGIAVDAPGMWDIVEKKLYENKGKGAFYYDGNDICNICNGAVYSPGGDLTSCISCPDGYVLDEEQGKTKPEQCKLACTSGTFVENVGENCKNVGPGYWAKAAVIDYGQVGVRNICPDGLTTTGYGAAANDESDCGKALNIGNTRIVFGKEKKTKHALAALIDGVVYYGAMSPNVNTINTLKVRADDGLVYSLHDDNSVDNVEMFGDKLLWVDENTYLASDGYQYIDTGVPGNNPNLSFKIKYAWTVLPRGYEAIFANYESETANITRLLQYGADMTLLYVDTRTNAPMASYKMVRKVNTPYVETLGFDNYTIGNTVIPLNASIKGQENNKSILLLKGAASEHPKLKIYYFKVYDKGKLVRNFVPVYKGAKIGEFIVPENGMWDIVEQKYYSNAGTGNFTYGYGG